MTTGPFNTSPIVSQTHNTPEWTMSQEREFMENLLCQRFNFFLIAVGAVLVAPFSGDLEKWSRIGVLGFGFAVCLLLTLSLYRVQRKLNEIIEELKKDVRHPLTLIDEAVGGWSCRNIIGYCIPTLCCLTILTVGVMVYKEMLPEKSPKQATKQTGSAPSTLSPTP